MKETQISVYIANKPGELAKVTSHLARFNINMRAISMVESSDYGIVRLITSDAERACAALCEMGWGFVTSDVIVAEIADRPGALADICKKLADDGINIRYLYATVTPGGGVAMAVISTEEDARAEQVIAGETKHAARI
jgi:hypothetical protein